MRVKGLGQPVRVVGVEADSGVNEHAAPRSAGPGQRPRRSDDPRRAGRGSRSRPRRCRGRVAAAAPSRARPRDRSPMPSSSPAAVASPVRASAASSPAGGGFTDPAPALAGCVPSTGVPCQQAPRSCPCPGPEDEFEKPPTVRWQFPATAAMGATPSVVNDQVYVGDLAGTAPRPRLRHGQGGLELRRRCADQDDSNRCRTGRSTLTTDDGRFQAIDLATHRVAGSVAGRSRPPLRPWSATRPTLVSPSGRFQALSVGDGRELWHVDVDGDAALNAALAGQRVRVERQDRPALRHRPHRPRDPLDCVDGTAQESSPRPSTTARSTWSRRTSRQEQPVTGPRCRTGTERWALGARSPEPARAARGGRRSVVHDLGRARWHHPCGLSNAPRVQLAWLETAPGSIRSSRPWSATRYLTTSAGSDGAIEA